jgi:hypothetical protein
MQEVSVFKCPICREESEIEHHVNGKKKLTCGKKECKIAWNHAKVYRRLKENFTCPYCKKTKFIFKEENRQYCTDGNCKRKHEVRERQKNKVLTLDELPIEDLQKAFPVFYSLVRKQGPEKYRKCLKCDNICHGNAGFRICAKCRYSNNQYGARASSL